MKKWISTLRRFFATRSANAENSAQRVLESVLPVASLYGVEIEKNNASFFWSRKLREASQEGHCHQANAA